MGYSGDSGCWQLQATYRRRRARLALRGRVSGFPTLTPFFQMPPGFRIAGGSDNIFPADAGTYIRLNIRSNGDLQVQNATAGYLSLTSISYLAA